MDTVLLDPPLVALDKDAPVPYAGRREAVQHSGTEGDGVEWMVWSGRGGGVVSSTSVKIFV